MGSKLQTLNRAFLAHSAAMLLACVLVASNARAEESVRSETVKFQDLNVGTSAGVEALYRRIQAAAKRVCTPPAGWVAQLGASTCAKDAQARAIATVNLPLLTAYYQMKTGDHTQRIAANR
jgi:UrcA family protein